jgi:cytochrome c-type biogenesis protein CcmH/NrfF
VDAAAAGGGFVVTLRGFAMTALCALALAAAPARAEEQPYSIELYNGLMSPYCPGRTLMDCPSGQATELRDWIAAQEKAGRSRQEVEDELYAQYGDVILQAPKAEGFGLAAYVLPIVAGLAGVGIVWVFLRRQAARMAAAPAPGPRGPTPIDPDLERRIDEELRAG